MLDRTRVGVLSFPQRNLDSVNAFTCLAVVYQIIAIAWSIGTSFDFRLAVFPLNPSPIKGGGLSGRVMEFH